MNAPPPEKKSPLLKIACFGCIGLVLLSVLCCGGMTMGVLGMIKSSQPYKDGLAKATSDPRVQMAIGEPMEAAWYTGGNLQDNGATGVAQNILIPLSGPKGEGLVTVDAVKEGGTWKMTQARFLIIKPAGGGTIDLMEGEDEGDKTESPPEEVKTDETPADR